MIEKEPEMSWNGPGKYIPPSALGYQPESKLESKPTFTFG